MARVPKAGNIPLMAGLLDMAVLFDVSPRTPTTWFRRGELPPEDVIISGKSRAWLVSRLEVWAANTDRPIYPGPAHPPPRHHRTPGRGHPRQGPEG